MAQEGSFGGVFCYNLSMVDKQFINDKYKKSRGGYSRLLIISCAKCEHSLCNYQKDRPGILKRMYFDRISGIIPNFKNNLLCPKCKEVLGIPIIYKKENRSAYRLFAASISKKIQKISNK